MAKGARTDAGLTDKQEAFAREYVRLGKAAAAYRKTYDASKMTPNAVWVEASRLLADPKVSLRVAELRKETLDRFGVTVDKIALGLARIAFADTRDAYDEKGALLPPHDMPEDLALAISSIEVVEMAGGAAIGGGEDVQHVPMFTKKMRLADRKGALDTLAKWRGMMVDRKETGKPGEFADLDSMTEEELEQEARGALEAAVKAGVVKVLRTSHKGTEAATKAKRRQA